MSLYQYLASLLSAAATVLLVVVAAADEQPVPALFIFGDSFADSGNNNVLLTVARANFYPYGLDFDDHHATGRFANGRLIPDFFASFLGLPFQPPFASAGDNILSGVNFASAGSGLINSSGNVFGQHIPLPQQVNNFRTVKEKLTTLVGAESASNIISRSIFYITAGSNDIGNNYYVLPVTPIQQQYTPSQFQDLLISVYSQQLQELYNLGARKFAIVGLVPLGCTPLTLLEYNIQNVGECVKLFNDATQSYNAAVGSLLVELRSSLPGVQIVYSNCYDTIVDLVQNPTKQDHLIFKITVSNREMAASSRRPRNIISSAMICNERDAEGTWITCNYKKFQWVLLHPSSRGAFRKRCRSNVDYRSFWKGRILEFKTSPAGKSISEVLIQHVYMHNEIVAPGVNIYDRHKLNYVYPSSLNEWQSVQSLAGIIDVIHSQIGLLQYKGRSAKSLLESGIFFYDAVYMPSKEGTNGELFATPIPGFASEEWILPDSSIAESYRARIFMDIQNSMKCSTGSKGNSLHWNMPFVMFVDFFSKSKVRKTASMYIVDLLENDTLEEIFDKHWNTKQIDKIECRVDIKSMRFRYRIEKQILSLNFYYMRWIRDNLEWKPLDQDLSNNHHNQMEVIVRFNAEPIATVEVEENWTLNFIRAELDILHNDLPKPYKFRLNNCMVRERAEEHILCKDLQDGIDICT